jgi:cellulose synthase/poly-beta-1,6-N-acetylglucosamine synthase-like glycosyltransferase
MTILLISLTVICAASVLHTYLFFPLWARWRSQGRDFNQICFEKSDDLPIVTVIMSVFNEEKVIMDKLNSLLHIDYPKEKWHWRIGSDGSSDATNQLIDDFKNTYPTENLHFTPFSNRRGKPPVLNDLVKQAIEQFGANANHILLLTDANVLLDKNVVFQLVKHFKNTDIVLMDANMIPVGMKSDGISTSEHQYLRSEVLLKYREGVILGKMLGPFGGCYALRSDFFTPVPPNYLVDDFYIAMCALEKGGKAGIELEAACYEGVSHDIGEEYRRKRRISSGNFQNLNTFAPILLKFDILSYLFFSHKVLRWITPFLILIGWFASGILAWKGFFWYEILFLGCSFVMLGLPILDLLLQKLNYNFRILRGIRYLIWMNVALLEGFFKYLSGIKSNIWQPTKRV